ncbi:hypothetical protein [Sinorhizobium sp. BG8]|uniref:hypothetical protein n=1 Tax=Sinorhizobium sp. BG8 TaxID=2613773 RepID=UPI00193CAF07|nr:hypothetical protein [Sinorhizobium sp. BG8]QRM54242.1 hypothetical protein F3Y30_06505 [Sinorhizobium sp. BG8]
MNTQIARYLKDFGAAERRAPNLFRSPSFGADDTSVAVRETMSLPAPEPRIDVAAERAEAHADGKAAGRTEAEAELSAAHAAELAALKEEHKAEIETMRRRYEKEYAAALAERFTTMTAKLSDLVSTQAAHVLAPVMDEVLEKKAIADMAKMIAEGLQAGEGLTVTVKGPARLFGALISHFGSDVPAFRHVEAEDLDLTVEFGETILVTRMAAWADTVRKVLA